MENTLRQKLTTSFNKFSLERIFSPTYVYAVVSGAKGAVFAWDFSKGEWGFFWSIIIQLVMIEQSLILAIVRAKKSDDLAQKRAYMMVWALMALFVGFGWFYQVQYLVQEATGVHIPESFIQFYLSTLSVFAAIAGYILLETIKIFGSGSEREKLKRKMFNQKAATIRAEAEWQRSNAEYRLTRAEMTAGRIAGFWLVFWIIGRMFGKAQLAALNEGAIRSYQTAFGKLSEEELASADLAPFLNPKSSTPKPTGDSLPRLMDGQPDAPEVEVQVAALACLNPRCHETVKRAEALHCGKDSCRRSIERGIQRVMKGTASGQDWHVYREACNRNDHKVRTIRAKMEEVA